RHPNRDCPAGTHARCHGAPRQGPRRAGDGASGVERMAIPKGPSRRPVPLRYTAQDLKLAEARQATARKDLAKGRASVARARAAIKRGRETLVRRAKAGELDRVLAPIRANFDAAEAALHAIVEKLNAVDARLEAGQRRLDEAREQVSRAAHRPPDRSS